MKYSKAEWDPSYSVGHDEIDEQHKILFKLLNDLVEYIDESNETKLLTDTLTKMTQYMRFHFNTEEQLMKEHNFEGLESHRQEHIDFIKKTGELNYLSMQGNKELLTSTIEFLKSWLTNHILITDAKMKSFHKNETTDL